MVKDLMVECVLHQTVALFPAGNTCIQQTHRVQPTLVLLQKLTNANCNVTCFVSKDLSQKSTRSFVDYLFNILFMITYIRCYL